jgi:hypothetical protein
VGLFEVSRVQELLAHGASGVRPDRVYWDGEDRTEDEPTDVIAAFLQRRGSSWGILEENLRNSTAAGAPGDPLALCPVARTIIGRHVKLRTEEQISPQFPTGNGPFDIFLSFASEDRTLARQVFDELAVTANHRVFFSDVTTAGGAFADKIDSALDSARAFVAVGTRIEHLHKSWVKYEWRNFHNDLNSGRKPANSPFFAFVAGIDPRDLPRPLRVQEAVTADPANPTSAFEKLAQFIGTQ